MNDQDEMFEAATETPAFLGCPEHMPIKLPGGFDGVEPDCAQGGGAVPAPHKVSEESRAKVEQSVIRMRQKLTKIADLALAAEAKSNSEHVKLGSKYLENSKAIAEIRRLCKQSFVEEVVPDYEWLAQIMTGDHFEPECLAKAIEAEASKRPIDYPTFYTPGWLCELAKKLEGTRGAECVPHSQKKPTMDFGRFHVTRAAIPGRTVLTFRRKQEVEENGSLVPGRIIVADIRRNDRGGKMMNEFIVKSSMPGEEPHTIFSGVSQVSMSKTEKIVYKMVKCNIKETQRRHITRKRKRDAAAKQQAHDNKGDAENGGQA